MQFIGKERILDAYNEYGAETWALFQGRKKVVAGDGAANLAHWLDMFSPAGSTATYTLRVYNDIEDPEHIGPSTDYSACWDFKLTDSYNGSMGGFGQLAQRLDAIEKKLSDEGPGEDGFDLNGIVTGWLKNPEQLGMVIGAVKQLLGHPPAPMPAMAAVGALDPQPGKENQPMNPEETYQRLSKVLDRLEKQDPQILEHLEKLATIAETKPKTFQFLISSLNGF